MTLSPKTRGRGAFVAAAALLTLAPAAAARPSADHPVKPVKPIVTHPSKPAPTPPVPTTTCTPPVVSQPFTAFGDPNYYTLAPGQTPGDFSGEGWTLSGGAKIVEAKLADGTQGHVLDLPMGSKAVSPAMCVTNLDPTARTRVMNVIGSAGVDIRVTYLTRHGHTVSTGNVKGPHDAWSLSRVVRIHPSSTSGWQLACFTLTPHGNKRSDYRIYDFYVDPHMVH